MKPCKPYCNTWHEYKYLGRGGGYIWLCFGYIQRIKEKVQVMFSGDGRGKKRSDREKKAEGQREEDS